MPDQRKPSESILDRRTGDSLGDPPSIYERRGTEHVGERDPETCMTATIETVDDDRASSLLGVVGPS
jgi:hypothetical protein